jgi:hypothetical protein
VEVSRAEVGPGAVGSSAGHRRDPADVPVLLPPLMPHPNALLQALEMLWICHCACFSCAHLASDKARYVNKRGVIAPLSETHGWRRHVSGAATQGRRTRPARAPEVAWRSVRGRQSAVRRFGLGCCRFGLGCCRFDRTLAAPARSTGIDTTYSLQGSDASDLPPLVAERGVGVFNYTTRGSRGQ